MSSRGLYQLDDGTFVRTQSEIPKGQTPNKVEVPIGSQELCDYLNAIITEERSKEHCPLPTQGCDSSDLASVNLGTGSPEMPEEVLVPSPPPAPNHAEQLLAFEDQWDEFPLSRKLHFASLATEEARTILDPKKYQPVKQEH